MPWPRPGSWARKQMSHTPEASASVTLPACSKGTMARGTPSRLASSVASATETPPGVPPGMRCASTGLPKLMAARSVPVGASAEGGWGGHGFGLRWLRARGSGAGEQGRQDGRSEPSCTAPAWFAAGVVCHRPGLPKVQDGPGAGLGAGDQAAELQVFLRRVRLAADRADGADRRRADAGGEAAIGAAAGELALDLQPAGGRAPRHTASNSRLAAGRLRQRHELALDRQLGLRARDGAAVDDGGDARP